MRSATVALLAAFVTAGAAQAQEPISTTRHQIRLHGRTLAYVADAGRMEVKDSQGQVRGDLFFVSYRVPTKGKPRPVTFFFPGGPGGASDTPHTVYGPKAVTYPGAAINQNTLLEVSDLVFVDPISTGFSRLRDPQETADFYTTLGDQAYTARFVQDWRARFGSPDAPVFLQGQSYGVPRANGVAELLSRAGVPVRGTILTSGGRIAVTTDLPPALDAALRAPSLAMAAFAHGKLQGASAEEVRARTEAWARTVYAPLLERRDELSPAAREAAAADIAAHIGVPAAAVQRQTLTFTPRAFNATLVAPRALELYDRRKAGPDAETAPPAQRAASLKTYLSEELGYRADLPYWTLDPGQPPVNASWKYTGDPAAYAWATAGGGPPESLPWISRTLAINPKMKVLVAVGYYDSQNSCEVNAETRRRLPPAEARAITTRCYVGGHRIQADAQSFVALNRDVAEFIRTTAATRP